MAGTVFDIEFENPSPIATSMFSGGADSTLTVIDAYSKDALSVINSFGGLEERLLRNLKDIATQLTGVDIDGLLRQFNLLKNFNYDKFLSIMYTMYPGMAGLLQNLSGISQQFLEDNVSSFSDTKISVGPVNIQINQADLPDFLAIQNASKAVAALLPSTPPTYTSAQSDALIKAALIVQAAEAGMYGVYTGLISTLPATTMRDIAVFLLPYIWASGNLMLLKEILAIPSNIVYLRNFFPNFIDNFINNFRIPDALPQWEYYRLYDELIAAFNLFDPRWYIFDRNIGGNTVETLYCSKVISSRAAPFVRLAKAKIASLYLAPDIPANTTVVTFDFVAMMPYTPRTGFENKDYQFVETHGFGFLTVESELAKLVVGFKPKVIG